MNETVAVLKLNPRGETVWRYSGRVLRRSAEEVIIEAFFDRADTLFHGMTLRRGDRFVEWYSAREWYNIFEVYDVDSGDLKGWYCNITRPARISGEEIAYEDLALDLLAFPDGSLIVLDEDEFAALEIDAAERERALRALEELKQRLSGGFRLESPRPA